MKINFLGTGTSQGIPIIGCNCPVCTSLDFRDKRLRTSIYIEIHEKSFIIDTGPDFRQQVLREKIIQLDAILFTHEHKDHTAGLDDIRGFNFLQKKNLPVYGHPRMLNQLCAEFAYAFSPNKYPGVPLIDLHEIDNEVFEVENISFTPIEVMHHKLPVFGYRVGDFTYITDANYIADKEIEKAKGSKVLVLNALQKTPHLSHFTLAEALEMIERIQPQQAYLTHLSHNMGLHAEVSAELPSNVKLAYDGLKLQV